MCREDGQLKAYGAGLLSSFGELEYSCAPYRPAGDADEYPELLPWDPVVAAETDFPITTYQPTYFVAQNLADAKQRMRKFCESINRPFYARYNSNTQGVWVDRAVSLGEVHVGSRRTPPAPKRLRRTALAEPPALRCAFRRRRATRTYARPMRAFLTLATCALALGRLQARLTSTTDASHQPARRVPVRYSNWPWRRSRTSPGYRPVGNCR